MSEIVYLSLGSNIGDRESNIAGAITALGTYSEIHNIQSASFYETEPLLNQDQPKFLNTVVFCSTEFSPFQFLDAVKNTASFHWAFKYFFRVKYTFTGIL